MLEVESLRAADGERRDLRYTTMYMRQTWLYTGYVLVSVYRLLLSSLYVDEGLHRWGLLHPGLECPQPLAYSYSGW